MIRFIAALDQKNGLADDNGIPWQGKVPGDVAYFRSKTLHSKILMGYRMYLELSEPLTDRHNYVATQKNEILREGFKLVQDVEKFFLNTSDDIWVVGGALLYETTLEFADELYVTRLNTDFHCTKFFPDFEDSFKLIDETKPVTENGVMYHMEVWNRSIRPSKK